MYNRDYSPAKLFRLIRSDTDAESYLKLYTSRLFMSKLILCLSFFMLCSILIIDTISDFIPLLRNLIQHATIHHAFIIMTIIGFSGMVICPICIGVYKQIIMSIQPIAHTLRCIEVERIIMDYSSARQIRDDVVKQGRQLYGFDADLMNDVTVDARSDVTNEKIEEACKNIYGITNNV